MTNSSPGCWRGGASRLRRSSAISIRRLRDLMPDPFVMRDMEAATARLRRAVERGESVAIFGDYDVDGACSAALLSEYLAACGLETIVHIPDRVTEGYGPNAEAIAGFAAKGATLVVTVDCGAVEPRALRARARALGLDVVVFDHHQAPESAAATRWRWSIRTGRTTCRASAISAPRASSSWRWSRSTGRCAQAGFWTGRQAPDLIGALDLVALATVADVVPLTGLNRAFVVKGLAGHAPAPPAGACRPVRRRRRRRAAAALSSGLRRSGRASMRAAGSATRRSGRRLLMTADEIEARAIAAELDRLNRARQQIEIAALAEAEAEALLVARARGAGRGGGGRGRDTGRPASSAFSAARLKERFDRPAFACSLAGGHATGSGRSIAGVDLGRTVRAAVEAGLLVKGGGHAMAAGVTLASERLGEWRAFLEETAGRAGGAGARRSGPRHRRGNDRGRRDARRSPIGSKPPGPTARAIPSRSSSCRAIASPT